VRYLELLLGEVEMRTVYDLLCLPFHVIQAYTFLYLPDDDNDDDNDNDDDDDDDYDEDDNDDDDDAYIQFRANLFEIKNPYTTS